MPATVGFEDRWTIKIHAMLHDPPHKPLALGRGHERQGRVVAEALAGSKPTDEMWRAIKEADALASGADRESWMRNLEVDPRSELELVHPIDGRPVVVPGTVTGRALEIVFAPEVVDRAEELVARLAEVFSGVSDIRLRYLLLWRFAADALRELEEEGERHERRFRLGVLWDLLPADTRIPDHPLTFHDSLVAALAPIVLTGGEAALLRFSLGPVQPFIETARKLRDLWAGSSILAETAWRAMQPIVEQWGPDSVVFPNLRGEPRFDRWLLERLEGVKLTPLLDNMRKTANDHRDRALRIPSLPNVFTAIVPLAEAESLAETCERAARSYWEDSAAEAARAAGEGDAFDVRAREQARASIEIAWGIAPWPLLQKLSEGALRSRPRWHRSTLHAERAYEHGKKLRGALGGYEPNGGILYADGFEQAVTLVDAAKRERLPFVREEEGLKCSVCGEREVLGPGNFWEQRHSGRERRADASKLDEGEQLCGLCTWKRHFDRSPLGSRHPSTGEIAAAAFKLEIIQKYADAPKLYQAIKEFCDRADDARREGALDPADLNVWSVQAVENRVRESREPLIGEFAKIDGQWLLPFPREEVRAVEPKGRAARAALERFVEAGRRLREAAVSCGIETPRPYLAVVVFDGDEMGKWLSGAHPSFPKLRDVLHRRVKQELERENVRIDPAFRRFLAPSFHATFSGVAAAFARYVAPMTIEGEGLCGHLVYAGGDDVLFLAPIAHALDLALRLRLRFSGWPGSFDSWASGARPVRPWAAVRLGDRGLPMPAEDPGDVDRLALAFGAGVTGSAGMCVFHFRWPLGSALEGAREAERKAKNAGRNALGIKIQRRSGSITETILPFPTSVSRTGDPVAESGENGHTWGLAASPLLDVLELVRLFREGAASPRLASLFRSEIEELLRNAGHSAQLREMAEAIAQRVASRRETAVREEAKGPLREAMHGLGRKIFDWKEKTAGAAAAARSWSEALVAAAFLARPGDRSE